MGKVVKDLKLKKVGSESKSENDELYSAGGYYLTERDADRIKRKKSRRRFFTGFACISIIIAIIGTLIAGAFVAWDYDLIDDNGGKVSLKDMTGLELPEAVGMIADLYGDGSGVVTNPYDESDLDSFYVSLKKGLYLSEECEISITDIVSGLLSQMTSGENSGENSEQTLTNGGKLIMADESAPEIGDNGSITGNKALDDLLESLEFDFSVLENKDQETLEKEMLELSDKELAAVLNEAFSSITELDALKKIETDYGVNVANVLSVEQVIIDQATVLEQEDVRVRATIKINLRDAAKTALINNKDQLLSKLFGENVPSVVKGVADIIPSVLPEALYVTASVYPNKQTWSANVAVNDMDDKQQAAINKLLDKFLATTDEEGNNVSFMQSINAKVYDTIVKINDLIPINFTATGSVDTKPIQAVINMLGAENLTQGDFLALIRDVKLPTAESLGVDGFTEEAQLKAANAFINGEFSEKYYFNNTVEGSADEYFITASNLFTKLNTFSEDEETLKRIEIRDKIVAGLDYGDGGAFRPFADEETLAALLNGYLKNQEYKVENMEPWIMDVTCTATGTDDVKGDYFTLTITIELDLTGNIDAQLGDNESMKRLVKQLLPDSIYVFLTYTQYAGTDENPSAALVDINKKGNEMSRQHFETLMSLLNAVQKKGESSGEAIEGEDQIEEVSNMTFDDLEKQLNEKIYQAFTDIEANLGAEIEFVSGSGSAKGGAVLPNIFEVLAANEKLRYDPEQDASMTEDEFNATYKMDGAEMYLILSQTYKYDPEAEDSDVKTNMDETVAAQGITSFVSEIDSKYYIDTDVEGEDWSASNIETMLNTVSGEYQTRLRMNATDGKSGLLDDTTAYDLLRPYLSQYEFANVVNESGKLDNLMQILPSSKVEYILIYIDDETGLPKVRIRINGDISFDNVTGEGAEAVEQNKKYETLFPYDVDIIVDISVSYNNDGDPVYDAKVDLNDIGDDYLDKMLFFVKRFSGQSTVGDGEDKQDFSKEGLELTIESKLTAAFNDMNADGSVSTEFVEKDATEGGLEFSTVFDLAVNKIYTEVGEEKPAGETMRSTIKGLHEGLEGYALSNGGYESPIDETGAGTDDSTFTITPSTDGTSITINAQFLDAYMNTKMTGAQFEEIVGGNAEDISFYQSYILPKYNNGTTEETDQTNAIRAYYNEGLSGENVRIDAATSYLLVTLEVNTDNLFTGENATGRNNNLVPDKIYVNAVIAIPEDPNASGDSQALTEIFVNRMTDEECNIMNRILKNAGYEKDLFGNEVGEDGLTSTQRMINKIFETELVNYDYNYNFSIAGESITGFYKVVITVEDVVDASFVWYCSLYDTSAGEDDRKAYIKDELTYSVGADTFEKTFDGTGDARRYGIAYLRYERTLSLADAVL